MLINWTTKKRVHGRTVIVVHSLGFGSMVEQNNEALEMALYHKRRALYAQKRADLFTGCLPFNENPGEM